MQSAIVSLEKYQSVICGVRNNCICVSDVSSQRYCCDKYQVQFSCYSYSYG